MQMRVKLTGVESHNTIDKQQRISYTVYVMKTLINKYYQYPTGDFFVIREGDRITNMRAYHLYKIKKLLPFLDTI